MTETRHIVLAVITRIAVSVVILGASVAVFLALVMTKPEPQRRTEMQDLRRVVVMQAQPVDVRRQFEGYGTAEAMDSSDVPARVSATVIERPEGIRAGQFVEQGQLIARLDPSDFEQQVQISTDAIADIEAQLARLAVEERSWQDRVKLAEDEVRLANAEYQRAQDAQQREAAKQREVEIAELAWVRAKKELVNTREELDKIPAMRQRLEAQKRGQQASLDLARQNLERCTIVSPLDGVLQAVDVEIGENVAVGARVARVVSLRRIEVPLRIPASSRPYLEVGDDVHLESAGNSRQSWTATVSRIAPEDDESTRTMTVFVEMTQDKGDASLLAPGKFVRATISSARPTTRWVVPRRAMRNDRITLVEDNQIASRRVDVDFQVQQTFPQLGLPDDLWLVLSEPAPLVPGAFVVVTPSRTLVEGLPVEPVLATGQPTAALSAQEPAK